MDFHQFLHNHIVCLDGGMGTLLQARGLQPGEYPERWNISHPDEIIAIHQAYFDAGSNVVCTNTFGANSLKFGDAELEKIISSAIANANQARENSGSSAEKFIALDIGPTGKMLRPFGDLDFEDAVSIFAKTIRLGVKYGVDLIIIETMNDSYETKAALLAARENSDLPVIVSNAYGADGKLMTGASPAAMVSLLEGMGADALGANCSLGPRQLRSVAEELLEDASVPVILKPNAGLPRLENGKTVFDITMDEFSDEIASLVEKGVRVVGGCCGTTPEYIRSLKEKIRFRSPKAISQKNFTLVSSYSHAVIFGKSPILIGERINPTGKKRLKQALLENDMNYLLSEGVSQQEKGAHILDVNVGLPEIDEKEMLQNAVCELQAVLNLPLQIDTANPAAMEGALRRYNGKAMINSVSGKRESMDAIFPLAKKYGGVIVALTLDENGIPQSAEGRLEIAKKILDTAAAYGIHPKNIVFDPLALTISADARSAQVTLETLKRIRDELHCHTSLGISNVSFGLPKRDAINSIYFAIALENGLSAAIMNPFSQEMMKTYHAYRALKGLDENCAGYIAASDQFTCGIPAASPASERAPLENDVSDLQRAIIRGFQEKAGVITRSLLAHMQPLEIVNAQIIPALNQVGDGYEKKTVYLPQLLMSAEAAKAAFEAIKAHESAGEKTADKGPFVLATVQGDIHDIGKNIVRLLLENYGFLVVDLGKDVAPEKISDAVIAHHAPIAGLSALMTTTVPAMEKTIQLLHEKAPFCKVVVGGAVLTQDYADQIGADHYARDAMDTVRYAQSILND